jgi:3-phosphoshikimate 1-carboxyvinyltransferase
LSAVTAIGTTAEVRPADRLAGSPRLPGDKSISHRALLLGLLSAGTTTIRGLSDGADVRSTEGVVRALGAQVTESTGGERRVVEVRSPGIDGLAAPANVLDCGNSGTTMRLFSGILAGQPFASLLDGDASLRGRPMARIIEPLRAMGAEVAGSGPDGARPPLRITGRAPLRAIDWTTPVPSAQVKSAILLAGLRARGATRVHEAVGTRDHTERMLRARGVDVRTTEDHGGWTIELDGGQPVAARDELIWADPSAAAFWLVAGAIHPAAELRLSYVDLNPRRRAAVDLLRAMGASIEVFDLRKLEIAGGDEPVGHLVVRSSDLRAIEVAPSDTAAAIDEIPVLCLAATQARGRTLIRGAGELRHKESDRIAGIVGGLTALGARIESVGDDIAIEGPIALRGSVVDSHGDHRLALTFAIAGLVAEGVTTIREAESVGISYPTFFADLERIRS